MFMVFHAIEWMRLVWTWGGVISPSGHEDQLEELKVGVSKAIAIQKNSIVLNTWQSFAHFYFDYLFMLMPKNIIDDNRINYLENLFLNGKPIQSFLSQ